MVEFNVFGVSNLTRISVDPGGVFKDWACVHTRRKRFLWWHYEEGVLCSYDNKVIYAYPEVKAQNFHNYYCERCFNKYLKPQLVKSGLLW